MLLGFLWSFHGQRKMKQKSVFVSSIDAYLMIKRVAKKSELQFWSLPMSGFHWKFQLRTLTPYFWLVKWILFTFLGRLMMFKQQRILLQAPICGETRNLWTLNMELIFLTKICLDLMSTGLIFFCGRIKITRLSNFKESLKLSIESSRKRQIARKRNG